MKYEELAKKEKKRMDIIVNRAVAISRHLFSGGTDKEIKREIIRRFEAATERIDR